MYVTATATPDPTATRFAVRADDWARSRLSGALLRWAGGPTLFVGAVGYLYREVFDDGSVFFFLGRALPQDGDGNPVTFGQFRRYDDLGITRSVFGLVRVTYIGDVVRCVRQAEGLDAAAASAAASTGGDDDTPEF